jgi:hypothetical protein
MNFESTPTVSAPSISSSAMLVDLGISVWTGRKKDKRASAEVADTNHAKRGVASVNKALLGDCAELAAIGKFAAMVRQSHYASTMPWSDTGLRLLPTQRYFAYVEQMSGFQQEFNRLVEAFLSNYEWEVLQAHAKLGDLFNADEYPTVDSLRDKFGFRLNYIPLSDSGDWRLDMEAEAQQALREQYDGFYRKQMEAAMDDVIQRVTGELQRFVKQLDVDEEGRRGKIYQSTLDNVRNLTKLLEECNFTNDPTISLALAKLRQTLRGLDPTALKKNEVFRDETKRDLQAAIAALPSLDM